MITDPKRRSEAISLGLNPDTATFEPETQPQAATNAPETSAFGAGARAAGRGLVPSLGAAIGGAGGYAAATAFAPETLGLSYLVPIAGSLLGAGAGSLLAEKAQDVGLKAVAPNFKDEMDRQAALDVAQHPVASAVGGIAGALPAFEFSPGASVKGLTAAYRLARGVVPEAEQAAARLAASSTGAQLGLGAASGVVNPLMEGRAPTMEDIGMGAGQAALLGRHRGWIGKVPGLGFMAHPAEGPLVPAFEPQAMSQHDQPIGPQEPMAQQVDRSFGIGEESPMTRLYRARYGEATPPPAAPLTPSLGVGITPDVSATMPSPLGLVDRSGEVRVAPARPEAVPLNDPVINDLHRQLEEARNLASNPILPQHVRFKAQIDLAEAQKKLEAATIAAQAGQAPVRVLDVGTPNPQKATAVPPFKPTAPPIVPPEPPPIVPGAATTPQPRMNIPGFFTKPNPLRSAAEKVGFRTEPRIGITYSSASAEKAAEIRAYNEAKGGSDIPPLEPPKGPNAPNPITPPTGLPVEHPGIPQRENLPAHETQVRSQEGQPTGGGSRVLSRETLSPSQPFNPKQAKAQKKYLLSEVSRLMEAAPEGEREMPPAKSPEGLPEGLSKDQWTAYEAERNRVGASNRAKFGEVVIDVPGDGQFRVLNEKGALRDFNERAKNFPTTSPKPTSPGFKRETPTAPAPIGSMDSKDVATALSLHTSKDPGRAAIMTAWSNGKETFSTDGRRMLIVSKGFGGTEKNPVRVDDKGNAAPKVKGGIEPPKYKQVVPQNVPLVGKGVDTGKLFTIVRQAQEMTSEKNNSIVLWKNPDGSLGVTSRAVDLGEYEHNKHPDAQVLGAYDPQFFLDGLNSMRHLGHESVDIHVTDELSPMVMQAKGAKFILMPMRLTQEARTNIRPEQLLTHPANADILAFTEQVANRHNATLRQTDAPITAPEGKLAAGVADLKRRLAHFNGSLATVDTGLHEIGHIFVDDLRTSENPVERKLYDAGVIAANGNEEKLVQMIGVRAADLGKMRIEGNTLARFRAWSKDFWSWVKHKWGSASNQDLANLMARRMVDGEAVARGERPTLSSSDNPKFQTREQQEEEARNYQRHAEAHGELAKHDFTTPLIRSVMEKVKAIPFGGQHLYDAFNHMYDVRNDVLGKYKNAAFTAISHLSAREQDSIAERMLKFREDPNYTGPPMSPKVQEAYDRVRAIWDESARDFNERGIRVMGETGPREILINGRYFPHLLSAHAYEVMSNKQGSPEFNAMRNDFLAWMEKGGLHGPEAAVTPEEARAMWEARVKFPSQQAPREDAAFGPLEKQAGLGLPPSMREAQLRSVLNRYFDRAAEKVAWHEFVEKDTPDNAISRKLLDATDSNGAKRTQATHFADGTEIPYLGSQPDVAHGVKDFLRNYDRQERFADAINRNITGVLLGPMTGAADAIGGIAGAAQHLQLQDYLLFGPKAFADIKAGITAGTRMNVIQARASRLQSTIEGGTNLHEMMGKRMDRATDILNTTADFIYRVSGRDLLEKVGRGLLMNMGMMKTEAALGRLRAGVRTAADLKWMDDFMGRGQWENLLAGGKDGVSADIAHQIAAKFVQSVQGRYDAFGLPAFALSGQFAPFFRLAKWNIEKANNFTRYVLNPLKGGDVAPLLKMTILGAAGGELIQAVRQLLTDKKPQTATPQEIYEAGGDGLPYRLLASMSFSGYSGIFADLLKQIADVTHGNQPQGFRFPLIGAIQSTAQRGSQFVQAMESGENFFNILPQFITAVSKDNIQVARMALRFASEDEQRQIDEANQLRDLKVFRQLHNIPVPFSTGGMANPMLNPLKREFQEADVTKAATLAPQLFSQAMTRSGGDPERLKALLSNLHGQTAEPVPSISSTPAQWAAYMNWIARTQGPQAQAALLRDSMMKAATDQAKRQMIPSL